MNSFKFWKIWDQADFCSFISLEAVLQQKHLIRIWSWISPNLILPKAVLFVPSANISRTVSELSYLRQFSEFIFFAWKQMKLSKKERDD